MIRNRCYKDIQNLTNEFGLRLILVLWSFLPFFFLSRVCVCVCVCACACVPACLPACLPASSARAFMRACVCVASCCTRHNIHGRSTQTNVSKERCCFVCLFFVCFLLLVVLFCLFLLFFLCCCSFCAVVLCCCFLDKCSRLKKIKRW